MKTFTKQLIFISLGVAILAAGGVLIFAVADKGAGPVAYWKFNEGSASSTYDSSGNANTGTMYGGVQWASGVYGTALSFDGTDDYVQIGNNMAFDSGSVISYGAWIKVNPEDNSEVSDAILVRDVLSYKYLLALEGNGAGNHTVRAYIKIGATDYYTNGQAITDSSWHHVFATFDKSLSSNRLKLYVDGILVKQADAVSGSIDSGSSDITIGSMYSSVTSGINGLIDDVRIYNYARTADQVRADYNDGKALYVGARAADCDVSPADCVNKGLVGYWDMSQMGGQTVADKSGNANTGTLGAATTAGADDPKWATGIQPFSGGRPGGGALSFDGVDDYVDAGNGASLNFTSGNFSIEAWIKPNSITGGGKHYIFTRGLYGVDGYYLFQIDQALYLRTNQSGAQQYSQTANVLTAGTWFHVVARRVGSSVRIYINGIDQTSVVGSHVDPTSATRSVKIGTYDDGTEFFNGTIDDVRIYNRVLSAAEISYQYNQAKPIAQWKFDEGSGNYAYDSSGNANTGTLNLGGSATSSDWVSGAYGGAMSFDGTDDYVSVSNSITMATGTLSFWAKPNTTTQKLIELSASDYVSLASGIVTVAGFGTEVVYVDGKQTTTFPDTNWHHIAIVSSASITANTVNLGKNSTTYYNGLLDDVRIYNYARTADQVRADYNDGKALYVGARAADCDVSPADCVNKGLVGYWDMSAMGGQTVADKSGNANTGTLGAATTPGADDPKWTSGVQPFSGGRPGGGALSFDGVDDYVGTVSNSGFSGTGARTLALWIKPGAKQGRQDVFTGGTNQAHRGFGILYDYTNEGVYFGSYANDYGGSINTITRGAWNHIAVTYDGNVAVAIYVNGKLDVSGNLGSSIDIGVASMVTGVGTDSSAHGFDGLIDDIRIYNRALSAAEISYQYNQAKPIGWWKMDEGADTATTCNATISSVYDYSGNPSAGSGQANGTLSSANATPATSSMWIEGKYGCALSFDGTDDYVAVSNSITMATGTLSFWAKPNTTTQKLIELSASDYVSLASGVVTVAGFGTEVVYVDAKQTTTFPDTNWHHITIVSTAAITANTVNLGKNSTTYYTGLLDDVRLYNYALTADQVRNAYSTGALHLGN